MRFQPSGDVAAHAARACSRSRGARRCAACLYAAPDGIAEGSARRAIGAPPRAGAKRADVAPLGADEALDVRRHAGAPCGCDLRRARAAARTSRPGPSSRTAPTMSGGFRRRCSSDRRSGAPRSSRRAGRRRSRPRRCGSRRRRRRSGGRSRSRASSRARAAAPSSSANVRPRFESKDARQRRSR